MTISKFPPCVVEICNTFQGNPLFSQRSYGCRFVSKREDLPFCHESAFVCVKSATSYGYMPFVFDTFLHFGVFCSLWIRTF